MRTLTLNGKIAIVTGAGRGIGRAAALEFVRHAARVVIVSRTETELAKVEAEVRGLGGDAMAISANVADEHQVIGLFERVTRAWGIPDYLVNNAGVFGRAPIAELPTQMWRHVFDVNVDGVFYASREAFRRWQLAPGRRAIVNISSIGGVRGTEKFPGTSAYVASKFAVIGFTEALAAEGRALGVRVNCVAPGAVATKMLAEAAPQLRTETMPADVARTIVQLCDESLSSHLNGSVIEIFSNLPA